MAPIQLGQAPALCASCLLLPVTNYKERSTLRRWEPDTTGWLHRRHEARQFSRHRVVVHAATGSAASAACTSRQLAGLQKEGLSAQQVLDAVSPVPLEELMGAAAAMRDSAHRHITFSPKVFIPLTRLCRDRCAADFSALSVWRRAASLPLLAPCLCIKSRHELGFASTKLFPYTDKFTPQHRERVPCSCGYCTFATPPAAGRRAYMTLDEVLAVAWLGQEQGCTEALFTLGAWVGGSRSIGGEAAVAACAVGNACCLLRAAACASLCCQPGTCSTHTPRPHRAPAAALLRLWLDR